MVVEKLKEKTRSTEIDNSQCKFLSSFSSSSLVFVLEQICPE